MKIPHFSNASTLVLSLGVLLSFIIAVAASPGGWGVGFLIPYYVLIGLAVTVVVAFPLAVVGKIRKESHTIGSSIVLLVSVIGILIAASTFLNNRSERKAYIQETRSLFTETSWAKIVNKNGCPKGYGTGNSGDMAGLWSRASGGDVFVTDDGKAHYLSSPSRHKFCYSAPKLINGISLLEDQQYVFTSDSSGSCPSALPLKVESDGKDTVSMRLVAPHVREGFITWNWTRLGDELDLPYCADLSEAEIEALEDKERRKDPRLKEYYRDKDFQNKLLTPQEYYGDVYDIVVGRIRSCGDLEDRIGLIMTLEPNREFLGGAIRQRGQRTFKFHYTTNRGEGELEIDDLVDQSLLDEHYTANGSSLDGIRAVDEQTRTYVQCVKEHRLNKAYVSYQVAKSITGTDRAVITNNSPPLKLLDIDSTRPEGEFVYLVAGKTVRIQLQYTGQPEIYFTLPGTSPGESRIAPDVDTKEICIKIEPGKMYSLGMRLIDKQGAWFPVAYHQLSPTDRAQVESVQCEKEG